ncbi:MAG: YdeI/OmpD-associated family protein [Rhodospirillales bacterium]|nr:YdeI/OmpD-associated family protein [Acetobacter sp.]
MPVKAAHRLPEVDAYIARARPFAHPVLTHLRETIHRVVPEAEEAIKWSRPFFVYKGVILGNIAAFKEHCSLGLWGTEMAETLQQDGVLSAEGMGTFGRITSLADLPPQRKLEQYIQQAASLISTGIRSKSIQRVAKASRDAADIPEALKSALASNQLAATKFHSMSPGCRREYIEWIGEAKREETRQRRAATAVEWILEGKERNWKYGQPV